MDAGARRPLWLMDALEAQVKRLMDEPAAGQEMPFGGMPRGAAGRDTDGASMSLMDEEIRTNP